MERRVRRRALLGAAAGALAALVAACRGPEGETTFRPARTATAVGSRSGAAPANAVVIPTDLAARNPVGTVFPTPRQGAPMPDLLRMIGFVPNVQDATGGLLNFLSRWKGTLTFANLGAVKNLYGYSSVRSFSDLQAQNITATDYANATNGCYLTEFTGLSASPGAYRDAFGYDAFQVDREISAGQPPDAFSRMEGAFDAGTIIAKLQAGGYTLTNQGGIPYYTVRGDSELNLSDPRGRGARGGVNRGGVEKVGITASRF
jgi:hypothetical protein